VKVTPTTLLKRAARALSAAVLLATAAAAVPPAPDQAGVVRGSLAEIRGLRRVALLVSRTQTVDARDPALVAVEHYERAAAGTAIRPHVGGHRAAARLVNKYIRKYRSMTAVPSVAEADFVLVFNVLRVRGSFIPAEPYIFGKLFVVARAPGPGQPPRVVWESKGNDARLDDAVGDFLKALKAARGER
jgi:hypothetical protein